MRGLRYIFNSIKRTWIAILISSTFGIAIAILPFVFHEDLGSENYIFPKAFLVFTALYFAGITIMIGCRDISQNKLAPSYPIAREMYTKSVPIFISLMTTISMFIFIGVYFIFLWSISAETVQFSDTLMIACITCGTFFLCAPILIKIQVGVISAIYISIIPLVGIVMFAGAESDGFELPIWISAVIFIGVIIVGTAWTFVISKVLYRHRSVKQQMTACIYNR